MKELLIPPAAKRDKNSIEMARTWIAEEGLHCSLNIGIYSENPSVNEEKAWGIMLADMLRHIANALADSSETANTEIESRIRCFLIAELEEPSSNVAGSYIDKS